MSKESASQEDIIELHRKGWSFRVKTVKGKQYFSARKGGEERGLGPYTQDLRKLISELSKPRQSIDNANNEKPLDPSTTYTVTLSPSHLQPLPIKVEFFRSEIEAALFDIKFEMAKVKAVDCEYSFNGFCHYWDFMEDSERLDSIYERFGQDDYRLSIISHHAQLKEGNRDVLRVTELLCLECEKYIPRKKRESKRMTGVGRRIQP